MRRSRIAILTVLFAGGAVAAFYVVRSYLRQPAVEAARFIQAERRMVRTTVNATGTVRLRVGSEVRVGAQLSGIVKKLNVTVGSSVRVGDVIAEIDDAPIRARLAQADAQSQLDYATLERNRVNFDRAQQLF